MTLEELQQALEDRGASAQIHQSGVTIAAGAELQTRWTVWLYAPEDPEAAFFAETATDLTSAVTKVLAAWDGESEP